MNVIIKEACVESVAQAIKAEALGANRIELCAEWEVGGLTPSRALIELVQKEVSIPIRVMIRPRAGDFNYNQEEFQQMLESIELCKELGVEGVVFGVLKEDLTLDIPVITKLANAAYSLKVVVHKAIDETKSPVDSLKELLKIKKIDTVLTSGGKENAYDGAENLRKMIALSANEIEIMAQGHITTVNFDELHSLIGARAYHGKNIVGNI